MQGHFEVGAYHTPGLTQAQLDAALGPQAQRTPGCVADFLAQFDKRQEAKGKNLVMDNLAGVTFDALFGGSAVGNPYGRDASGTGLGTVTLTTIDSEPSYQETDGDNYVAQNAMPSQASSSACKRFYEDEVEPYLISEDVNGKEAITYRGRWLWLPAQAVSSVIRSLSVHYAFTNITTGSYRGIIARIRLKDSGGNPIVINKTSAITLFVEYKFTVVSV